MNPRIIRGSAWVFGDNLDTDQILPGRYLYLSKASDLAKYCLEEHRPDFRKRVKPGDIIIAGDNLGCGSSREHAPIALKALNVGCIIASSIARIFYRNCFNLGLPAMKLPDANDFFQDGNELIVNIESGKVENLTSGDEYLLDPLPSLLIDILDHGGLTELVKSKISGHKISSEIFSTCRRNPTE